MKKNRLGFTLVELMIVVAVIGILSAIAYPSYLQYLQKGRRAIAQGELLAYTSAMEQYYVQNGSSYLAGGGGAPNVYSNTITVGGVALYNITIPAVTASTYTLKATPIAGTVQAGNGWVRIKSTGVKAWNSPDGLIGHW